MIYCWYKKEKNVYLSLTNVFNLTVAKFINISELNIQHLIRLRQCGLLLKHRNAARNTNVITCSLSNAVLEAISGLLEHRTKRKQDWEGEIWW